MNNKAPHPEVYSPKNIVKQKAGNVTPCPEHDNIQTQLNILKQQALSRTVPFSVASFPVPAQLFHTASDEKLGGAWERG